MPETNQTETAAVGEFEKMATEWLTDETFKGAARIEFLEGRVLSLAKAVDSAYEGQREAIRRMSLPVTTNPVEVA